jgi:hypothetical protein
MDCLLVGVGELVALKSEAWAVFVEEAVRLLQALLDECGLQACFAYIATVGYFVKSKMAY